MCKISVYHNIFRKSFKNIEQCDHKKNQNEPAPINNHARADNIVVGSFAILKVPMEPKNQEPAASTSQHSNTV